MALSAPGCPRSRRYCKLQDQGSSCQPMPQRQSDCPCQTATVERMVCVLLPASQQSCADCRRLDLARMKVRRALPSACSRRLWQLGHVWRFRSRTRQRTASWNLAVLRTSNGCSYAEEQPWQRTASSNCVVLQSSMGLCLWTPLTVFMWFRASQASGNNGGHRAGGGRPWRGAIEYGT